MGDQGDKRCKAGSAQYSHERNTQLLRHAGWYKHLSVHQISRQFAVRTCMVEAMATRVEPGGPGVRMWSRGFMLPCRLVVIANRTRQTAVKLSAKVWHP